MVCHKCGRERIEGTKYCIKCGAPFDRSDSIKSDLTHLFFVLGTVVLMLVSGTIGYSVFSVKSQAAPTASEISNGIEDVYNETEDSDFTETAEAAEIEEETETTDVTETTDETEAAEDTELESMETEATGSIDDSETSDLDDLDVEDEVLRIRELYNTIQNDCGGYQISEHEWGTFYDGGRLKKAIVTAGYNGIESERWYFFEDDQLIFSFFFKPGDEQRFYFYNNRLFRWKDNDLTHDKAIDVPGWFELEDSIINEGSSLSG